MEYSICAVVVTYNRINLLQECIKSLKKQTRPLDAILVVNNDSYDGTKQWLDLQNDLIVLHQENLGGAGGFHNGMKKAYELGFDWIWCMDDDAHPLQNTLEILEINSKVEYSVVCPLVINKKKVVARDHRGFRKNKFINIDTLLSINQTLYFEDKKNVVIELFSFVGPLINRQAIEKVGFPIIEYFIHNDDIEYSLRISKVGTIILITDAFIVHESELDKDLIQIRFPFRNVNRKTFKNYWVKYYSIRNYIITFKKHYSNNLSFYLSISITVLKEISKIIMFDSKKWPRIKIILLSLYDGIKINYTRSLCEIKNKLYGIRS